jgi:hypothetical protein
MLKSFIYYDGIEQPFPMALEETNGWQMFPSK